MRLVVADTSPLNYLVLIGQVEILPALFERIFVPQTVRNELRQNEAPESVRRWIAAPPSWLEIVPTEQVNGDPELLRLDEGERAAILLATQIGADLLLINLPLPPGCVGRPAGSAFPERKVVKSTAAGAIKSAGASSRRGYRARSWRAAADEDGHYCFAVVL